MMTEYIDRNSLLNALDAAEKHGGMGMIIAGTLRRYVKSIPAVDVAPVVRCKDCKYFTKGPYVFDNSKCWCACWYDSVKDDDFCSYGAKKDLEDKS